MLFRSYQINIIPNKELSKLTLDEQICLYMHFVEKVSPKLDNYGYQKVIDNRTVSNSDIKAYVVKNANGEYMEKTEGDVSSTKLIGGIGDDVFRDAEANSINTINLPHGIEKIGNSAFQNASSLMNITIASSVKSLGHRAFKNCNRLSSVTIAPGILELGVETFANCNKLTSIVIPNTVNKIGTGAFANCKDGLTTINMSDITTDLEIGKFAFYNCAKLNSPTFSSSTVKIGDGAFAVDSSCTIPSGTMTRVELPNNASSLGDSIFDGRTTLEEVVMPSTYGNTVDKKDTSKLDEKFFRGCYNLKRVIFPTSCIYASFSERAFESLYYPEAFYVEGPATLKDRVTEAYPRQSAHAAGITYKFTVG